jgi:hypothetical protein
MAGRPLRRPYGTPKRNYGIPFPTLKRGANKHCAYGAFAFYISCALVRTCLMLSSIADDCNLGALA